MSIGLIPIYTMEATVRCTETLYLNRASKTVNVKRVCGLDGLADQSGYIPAPNRDEDGYDCSDR